MAGGNPWPPPHPLHSWLNAFVPGFISICALAYYAARLILPRRVLKLLARLTSPFRNFIQIEDLEDPIGDELRPCVWKCRVLASIALLENCLAASLLTAHAPIPRLSYVALLTWAYVFAHITFFPPRTVPYTLLLISLSHSLASLSDLGYHAFSRQGSANMLGVDAANFILSSVFVALSSTLPMQSVYPSPNVADSKSEPTVACTCPEDNVSLLEWLAVTYVEPVLKLASRRTLNESDVWQLSPYFKHKNIFLKHLRYREKHPNHSLLWFLLSSNSLDLMLDFTLQSWVAVVGFVPPYALQQILSSLSDPASDSKSVASFWALVTFLAHLSFAQVDVFQRWHSRRCYERTRGQMFCALHHKALVRQDVPSHIGAQGETGTADLGKITNLMQGDAYAVAQRFWEFSAFFLAPVRLTIALVFLYQVLGWSALCGVLVVLVAWILNYPLAKYNIRVTRASWKARDGRMNAVNELLQNVRFLKFFGWMNLWTSKVRNTRETELKWKVKEYMVDTAITFIWTWIPSATALVTFWSYTILAGEKLTVSKAFTAIALFSQLQGPMTALPGQFFAMLQAFVSMQRIEHFLNEAEVESWATSLKREERPPVNDSIGFRDACLEWYGIWSQESVVPFRLGPLNVVFPKGQLSLICGPTGSGKTMLLSALLGETNCVSGSVHLSKSGHNVAYSAQNPWIQHATVRDNIIFGSKYDADQYQAVIEACALIPDLERFDAGDMTEIGEKGITLSGGQRARIALARALYSPASVILLDDPLAAVDMHTGQHIVQNCLTGPLVQDRTIILVTHHIMVCLDVASYVVELAHGNVVHQGPAEDFKLKYMDELQAIEHEFPSTNDIDETDDNEADENVNKTNDTAPHANGQLNGKLVTEEARAEGRVALKTYMTYIRAVGLILWTLVLILMLLIHAINIGNQVYLSRWAEAFEHASPSDTLNPFSINLPPPDVDVWPWLWIYMGISLAGAITVVLYIALGYYASLQASRKLFLALLHRVSRAPSRFFDQTPIGRLLNRFTSDINTIDNSLLNSGRAALSGALNFLSSFAVIVLIIPRFAPFALIIAWLYIRLGPRYVNASRDLRRLESLSLSPAFAAFDELLRGLPHIRAYGVEHRYQEHFYMKVDKFQSFDHVYWLVNNWLRWRYDCLGSVVVFLTTLFAVLSSRVSSGFAAVAIVQAGIFAEASRQLVKVAAQLELDFNSVERVVEYLNIAQEAPAIIEDRRPPAYWPSSSGGLVVENLEIKYAPDLPMVLKGISFSVNSREKIGIVGRTGSGKSTLALSLLRMVEPTSGRIILDGIDITSIGLEDLRSRITIVSQDVSLFTGTLRSNIDVFNEHTDQACWDVVDRCHLRPLLVRASPDRQPSLDFPISMTGSLSAGERQLIALARAILRRPSFVIFDEATSQIDPQLDDLIQKTMREEFSEAIVLTIAHRLKTVMDYDRILVLDNGQIVEFDTPTALVTKQGGLFRSMYLNLRPTTSRIG